MAEIASFSFVCSFVKASDVLIVSVIKALCFVLFLLLCASERGHLPSPNFKLNMGSTYYNRVIDSTHRRTHPFSELRLMVILLFVNMTIKTTWSETAQHSVPD